MSRWLWALLGGVVLVAIAAVFWTASNQTNVTPPVSPGPTAVAPAPAPGAACSCAGRAETRALASALTCAPGCAGGRSPARSLSDRAARSHSGARCRTASRLAACSAPPRAPSLRPSSPTSLRCSRSGRRTAPAAARARTGGVGSRGRICAQEPRAAGRDLGLFRGGLRAALPAARRRLGLSAAGGQVRSGRDCRVAEEDPSAFRHLPDRSRV